MARGSVFKRGDRWTFVIDLGPDPATGRRRQQWKGGFKTRKEADAAMRRHAVEAEQGPIASRRKMRLGEYLDEWLVTVRPRLRETSWAAYAGSVGYLKAQLGAVPLRSLTPLQIESIYAQLLVNGGRDGRPLSAKTVRNAHVTLRKALADAYRLGLIVTNPAASARPPSVARLEHRTWTAADIRAFMAAAAGERFLAAYVLAATTGMRRGEVVGLRWPDIDFDRARLSVVQTVTTVRGELRVTAPKTAKSRRAVALDPSTLSVLRAHRKAQAAERLALGGAWEDRHDLVFPDEWGKPLHPDRLSQQFRRIVAAAGLPPIRLHDLRHTHATMALERGVHPKVVSERLGHATVGITLDLYSHVTPALDEDAARRVAAELFEDRGGRP